MAKKKSKRPGSKAPSAKGTKPSARPGAGTQRLNKILAGAGLGSRREVEELIVQGRVEVNREIVTDLAFKADPAEAKIKVDGQLLKAFRPVYFMLNKPKGVLSTNKDPSGRIRVVDLVPDRDRVFSVGRLDKSSEGLMLLTNDGELAQRLAHPRFRVQKAYFVVVSGVMTKEELAKLKKGVYLAEGFARIDGATIRKQKKASTELEIVLSEGKNREIRRILARAGHKVVVLKRIAIGPLRLGQLPVGASRQLTSNEVKMLYAATEASSKKKTKASKAKPKSERQPEKQPVKKKLAASEMDDEFFGGDLPEAEFYDDDFVGDFSGQSNQGSVIAYDDESDDGTKQPARRPAKKRARGQASSIQRGTKGSSSSRGTRGKKKGTSSGRGKGTAKKTGKRVSKETGSGRSARGATARKSTKGTGGKGTRRGSATSKPKARRRK